MFPVCAEKPSSAVILSFGCRYKKGARRRLPKCNLVTDYRTFIEDFQRLVQFVDYLDAREEYLPPVH